MFKETRRKRKIKERVRKGAKLLDNKHPSWATDINQDNLDLGSGSMCIVGQTFGDYTQGIADLDLTDEEIEAHGFVIENESDGIDYPDLDDAWLNEINKRTNGKETHANAH